MTRSVFVTGGTGYLGQPLIRALIQRGHAVRALARPASQQRLPPAATAVIGDALDAATFAHAVAPADTFVHLVGTPHPSPAKAEQFRAVDRVSIKAARERREPGRRASFRLFERRPSSTRDASVHPSARRRRVARSRKRNRGDDRVVAVEESGGDQGTAGDVGVEAPGIVPVAVQPGRDAAHALRDLHVDRRNDVRDSAAARLAGPLRAEDPRSRSATRALLPRPPAPQTAALAVSAGAHERDGALARIRRLRPSRLPPPTQTLAAAKVSAREKRGTNSVASRKRPPSRVHGYLVKSMAPEGKG